MEANEIIINITNNRRNILDLSERQYLCAIGHPNFYREQTRALEAPQLAYYYDIEKEHGMGGGYGGQNLEELCNKLKESLNFFHTKEKKLTIILTSETKKNSFDNESILGLEKLNWIKSKIYKTFENIHINY